MGTTNLVGLKKLGGHVPGAYVQQIYNNRIKDWWDRRPTNNKLWISKNKKAISTITYIRKLWSVEWNNFSYFVRAFHWIFLKIPCLVTVTIMWKLKLCKTEICSITVSLLCRNVKSWNLDTFFNLGDHHGRIPQNLSLCRFCLWIGLLILPFFPGF